MPIELSLDRSRNRLVATYTGRVTDEELLSAWRRYYEGGDWAPGVPELNDLSAADVTAVSSSAIQALAEYVTEFLQARNAGPVKVAVYAPDALPFGLGRMYEALASASPESVGVFRDLSQAEAWLESPIDDQG